MDQFGGRAFRSMYSCSPQLQWTWYLASILLLKFIRGWIHTQLDKYLGDPVPGAQAYNSGQGARIFADRNVTSWFSEHEKRYRYRQVDKSAGRSCSRGGKWYQRGVFEEWRVHHWTACRGKCVKGVEKIRLDLLKFCVELIFLCSECLISLRGHFAEIQFSVIVASSVTICDLNFVRVYYVYIEFWISCQYLVRRYSNLSTLWLVFLRTLVCEAPYLSLWVILSHILLFFRRKWKTLVAVVEVNISREMLPCLDFTSPAIVWNLMTYLSIISWTMIPFFEPTRVRNFVLDLSGYFMCFKCKWYFLFFKISASTSAVKWSNDRSSFLSSCHNSSSTTEGM